MSHGARGQMIVWVAVMLPLVFLPIAGLMIDAGVMFDAKRELQGMADGAARVGGMEINRGLLHNTVRNPRGTVTLDQGEAEARAREYLTRIGFRGPEAARIRVEPEFIEVVLSREVRPGFLRLVHVNAVTIHATGRAAPCAAVVGNDCT